ATAAVLDRVRETGRKLMLVTGRMLLDLRGVCPEADRLFDVVVAENGAVLYFPARRELRTLGDPPEPRLVEALGRHGVAFDFGSSIIASHERYAEEALAAIREAGVERTLVFNKGSMMLLPGGVTKGTGLAAALSAESLSPHNTVGIGDAENDHAFLALCECAVAVADAIPAIRERADHVTRAPNGRGVAEFVEEHVLADLVEIVPRIARHHLQLGERVDGTPVTIPAHATNLLIVGPSGSGKSTLTGVLVERLVEAGRTVCLLDPEGDYETLRELEGVVALGGKAEQALPAPDDLGQLLLHPRTSLVLDLSAMSRSEKVSYATKALATVAATRATSGMPHWLIVDEAQHVFPADGSSADEWVRTGREATCLIALSADDLSPEVRPMVNVLAATDVETFANALRTLRGESAVSGGAVGPARLDQGEAVLAFLEPTPRAVGFRVARRRLAHRRHIRKYAEGELPPERSFYFRGPAGQLRLRAANLTRFCELAEGVDEATWAHHLRGREYSAWMGQVIKDPELAAEVATLEEMSLPPADSRRRVMEAVRRRYAV
ncbi:MAG TPA: HAD hydrolase family protein, partial [Methylomirabilota bacterium]|nr:HAD hydrolase family protein [Methylomirabilota bacterium]